MKNDGYQFEMEFIEKLSNKNVEELDAELKRIITKSFGIEKGDISACKYYFHAKPDVVVRINEKTEYFSLKYGNSKCIHSEGIKSFILFLRENGISEKTQKIILLFHYGDGTLTGDGENRLSYYEVYKKMKSYIDDANKELNNKMLINKIFDRFLIKGAEGYRTARVDYFVVKTKNKLYFASTKELKDIAINKDYNYIKTLHFGPITIRPYVRNIKRRKDEYKREIMQGDWRQLKETIMEIDKKGHKKTFLTKG